ncbi:MAG: glycosyltransferase [Patescibacteria group bacterium]
MKILYIITQADGGGAQKYVLALAKHFGGSIAAGDEAQQLFTDARAAGLNVYPLKHLKREIHPWHDFWAIWEIRQLIKAAKPDIVHLNSTKAGVLGSFATIGIKTKTVFTAHGFRFLEPLPFALRMFYLALEKIASSYRDFIIAVSDADKRAALENKIIDGGKIQTIHKGISNIDFLTREEARKQLGLHADKKIYGTIANNYFTKGLDILVATGPTYGNLIAVIGKVSAEKKSTDNIRYLGYKPNASIYWKAFDIAIFPSRKEGFPFALLEAMQAGLPIIATQVGGIPEALGDAGLLVKPENPTRLAEAIDSLLNSPALAEGLAAKAKQRSQEFTEEKMFSETEKIYLKLLHT